MVSQDSLLVTLVKLVDCLPMPTLPPKRGRGHPLVYPDRLFLKALVIMIVRHLHNVHELLSVLAEPTEEMGLLRLLLTQQGRFPTRRTWDRRLKAIPQTLPLQIGCLGRYLVELIHPWITSGRAVAIDSTILRARGGVWHQKHREQGELPHCNGYLAHPFAKRPTWPPRSIFSFGMENRFPCQGERVPLATWEMETQSCKKN